ncbi:hypothetical protein DXG03_002256 [Asterophora parasitica]|uniref:Uncharacterized protein n=1 Tax=Asterophora parasitica TaxID=117018 RepID=A0A9P7G8Q1_9AGAR|nr:hypothetical protein DXG03_002256 [Asterophora parasitica]
MSSSTYVADAAPFAVNIERVDSDRTDESPFGSALTTPVDENVELFSGIAERLLAKNADGDLAVVHIGPHGDHLDGYGLIKAVQDGEKLSVGNALKNAPTPSPSLDQLEPTDGASPGNRRVSRARAGSVYNQFHPSLTPASVPTDKVTPYHFENILSSNSEDSARAAQELFSLLPYAHSPASFEDLALANNVLGSSLSNVSFSGLFYTVLRVIFFLPWCVLAGATILLFPAHLETVIFSTGYNTSVRGIRRFAFWADIAVELVSIFLSLLVVLWCKYPKLGVMAIGGVVAQTVYAWQGFTIDRRVPLGEDDRQSLYLVWKQYSLSNALVGMKQTEQGVLATGTGQDEASEVKDQGSES